MTAEISDAHWRYALRVYGSEGVSPACLHLQDTHGVDVNVLLIALYAGLEDGRKVGTEEIGKLDATAKELRETLVLPLRTIRRLLKPMPFGPGSEDLRNQIKKAEIHAEKFEQSRLALEAAAFSHGKASDAAALCWQVVTFFDPAASDKTHPATAQSIATVAHAAEGKSDA